MQIFLRSFFAVFCYTAVVNPTFGQTDLGGTILKEKLRQQQEHSLEQSRPGQDTQTDDIRGPVEESVCFEIDEIRLRGISAVPEKELNQITSKFAGHCLGRTSIDILLQAISAHYAEKGLITSRAYVPNQDISGGVLTIEVIEGRIESFVYQQIDTTGEPKAGKKRKLTTAVPMKPGDVFDLRSLEHGLEQMNRLSSSNVSANLVPGNTPGTSTVVISEHKEDQLRGNLGLDNNSSDETGRVRFKVGVEADDLLHLNDAVSVSYVGLENSNAITGNFSLPYQNWLFSVYGSYSESLSRLTQTSDLFNQTSNLTAKAERIVVRDSKKKIYAYSSVHTYANERYINLSALTPQKRSSIRIGIRNEHHIPSGILSADTSLAFGTKFFNADWDSNFIFPGSPRTKFAKLETQISYLHPLSNGHRITATAVGQLANEHLYSNEQLSIGGWETVRGYAGHGVAGDSGLYFRTEYGFGHKELNLAKLATAFSTIGLENTQLFKGLGYSTYLFLDAGIVNNKSSGKSSEIAGIGFGINAFVSRFSFSIAGAMPILRHGERKKRDFQSFINVSFKFL